LAFGLGPLVFGFGFLVLRSEISDFNCGKHKPKPKFKGPRPKTKDPSPTIVRNEHANQQRPHAPRHDTAFTVAVLHFQAKPSHFAGFVKQQFN
jgi:hypothetical protein